MKNIPDCIFLQIGCTPNSDTDFNELDTSAVSWCTDRINDTDIEYTLASEVTKMIEAYRTRFAEMEAELDFLKFGRTAAAPWAPWEGLPSHTYDLHCDTQILITVVDADQFASAHKEWQKKEGSFLQFSLRINPENFLRSIAFRIDRGEKPEVPGILWRVENQESTIEKHSN